MKVMVVSTQRGWRGGEQQARWLVEGLTSRDCTVQVLARRDGQFAQRMRTDGYSVITFSGSGRRPSGLWHIRKAIHSFAPDVVHCNDPHSLLAARMASWGRKVNAVASRRVDFRIRSVWKYRWCQRVICVSQAIADICGDCGIPAEKLSIVHSGVDPERIRSVNRAAATAIRAELGLGPQHQLALSVGALVDHKGHGCLLDALPDVMRRHPHLVLGVAGDGPLRESLALQARHNGLEHRIRWLGFRDDIPQLLRAADLFVFPSLQEGLGTSLIDAMLAECPIVATTAGGIPEVCQSPAGDPTAWLVPPGKPLALAGALHEALTDALADGGAESRRRVARARQLAERTFLCRHMVEGTLACYRQILVEPRPLNRKRAVRNKMALSS